ncbi:MAG: TRAP transporter large permease subunit [Spirochaetales bacterium]|nr:TRAP transporter large permease subunit [Spirochaetales bacterium]
MSFEFIALLMFLTMFVTLLSGRHIYAVIGGVAAIFSLILWGTGGIDMGYHSAFKLINWYPLVTLPIFVFIGYLFSASKISEDLYRLIHILTGPLRGGLAIGTIVLMAIISAINGLSVAGMSVGSSVALPEMLKKNYDKKMVTGVIQAGSSLGILIPPSVVLVLYGMIARQPVGHLWLAGVFPGLLMSALFVIYIVVRCWFQPELGPVLPREEWDIPIREKIKALKGGLLPLFIILMMSGLFLLGVTSLVESSAIGAIATIIAAGIKKRLNWKIINSVLTNTLSVSGMFMWVAMSAMAFAAIFDGLGAVHAISTLFLSHGFGPIGTIIAMQVSFLLLGTFLDDTAMLIIVAPLYIPLVVTLGFNPIWYGVLYTITCQIAYLTPPFGYNLFLMKAMAPKEISLSDIYRSIVPFIFLMILTIVILIIFPEIATWLPDLYFSR